MIFIINLTRGQMRFLTCVARVACLVYIIQFVHHDYRHINFSAGAPLNATKIAVMKASHVEVVRVGPELLFLVHKCCFLTFFCAM